MMTSRRGVMVFLWVGAGLSLAGCAKLLGPRTIEITQDELLEKLSKEFPLRKQVLDVFDVTAAAPTLRMLPEADRVSTLIPFTARERLLGGEFKGSIGVSFGLRFEPRDLTLRLRDTTVDQVDIGALPKRVMTRLGVWLAEEKLKDFPIHRFKPEDLRTADRLGYRVDSIKVAEKALVVRLVPRED